MSNFPLIIGITGKAGAGKDTFAKYLQLAFLSKGINTTLAWHATPIKAMLNTLYKYAGEESNWDDRAWKELSEILGITPRRAAQTLGTEWGRELFGADVWSKVLLKVAITEKELFGREVVICPDVRFNNECRNIELTDGLILNIHRDEQDANFRGGAHSSEAGVSNKYVSYHIANDGTLEELRNSAESLVTHLEWRVCRQDSNSTS